MNQKYPAFYSLLVLIGTLAKDAEKALDPKESLMQKLFDFQDAIPQFISFLPQAGQLSKEVSQFSAADYAQAAEQLVLDLNFTNGKAQGVIRAAFPVVDWLVQGFPLCKGLMDAVKA